MRHNINYVSNARDMPRELEALKSMVEADGHAITSCTRSTEHWFEAYPPGVTFP